MNKTFLTVFALIGIFLCGAIVGGVVADRYVRPLTIQKRAAEQQLNSQPWKRITNRLNPTAEQRGKIDAVLTAHMKEQQNVRNAQQAALDKLHAEIAAVLTPVQSAEYERIRAKNRENERVWQRWFREQRAKYEEPPFTISLPELLPPTAIPPKAGAKRPGPKQVPAAKQAPSVKQTPGAKQGPGAKQFPAKKQPPPAAPPAAPDPDAPPQQ